MKERKDFIQDQFDSKSGSEHQFQMVQFHKNFEKYDLIDPRQWISEINFKKK